MKITPAMRTILRDVALFAGFIVFVCLFAEWWKVYDLDGDEGVNLSKAVLLAQGYSLYDEIWSDQPPLLSYVLAAVHRFFPFDIGAQRFVILAFAALIVVCLYRLVLRFECRLAAVVAVVFLVTTASFLELGVSVMIGLPSVALAVLALDIVTRDRRAPANAALVVAGLVFASSLGMKLFTVVMLPTIMLAAAWEPDGRPTWHGAKRAMLFFFSSCVGFAAIYLGPLGVDLGQAIGTHGAALTSQAFAQKGGPVALFREIALRSGAAPLAIPMFAWFMFAVPERTRAIPLVWLLSGVAALVVHRPLWDHHVLLVMPAICWLAGAGVASMWQHGRNVGLLDFASSRMDVRVRRATFVGLGLAFIVLAERMVTDLIDARAELSRTPSFAEQSATTTLRITAGSGRVIADRPIDAYRIGHAVPPELAVWTEKRRATGALPDSVVLQAMTAGDVSAVLLRRFEFDDGFTARAREALTEATPAYDRYSLRSKQRLFLGQHAENQDAGGLAARIEAGLKELALLDGIGGVWRDGRHFDRVQSGRPLPEETVVTRPPGSAQELGQCLVAASRAANSDRLLLEALAIGRAIACTQRPDGGWPQKAQTSNACTGRNYPKGDRFGTFDDGTVPSVVEFAWSLSDALEARSVPTPPWLARMTRRGLDFVLAAQDAQGGWPQEVGDTLGYHTRLTLNDDLATGLIRFLIAAHERTGDRRYLDAAVRGGEMLLKVQGPPGTDGYAQQYSDDLKPAPGRSFEPAAYASLETGYAINALIDLYKVTGDARYLAAARRAADWLKRSEIAPGIWARFYEPGANRPLYADRQGRTLHDIGELPEALRRGYRWQGGVETFPAIGRAFDRLAALHRGPDALRRLDEEYMAGALFADLPTARMSFDGVPPAGDPVAPPGVVTTRAFVLQCAGEIGAVLRR